VVCAGQRWVLPAAQVGAPCCTVQTQALGAACLEAAAAAPCPAICGTTLCCSLRYGSCSLGYGSCSLRIRKLLATDTEAARCGTKRGTLRCLRRSKGGSQHCQKRLPGRFRGDACCVRNVPPLRCCSSTRQHRQRDACAQGVPRHTAATHGTDALCQELTPPVPGTDVPAAALGATCRLLAHVAAKHSPQASMHEQNAPEPPMVLPPTGANHTQVQHVCTAGLTRGATPPAR
jgi:hypothetical protein